MAGWASALDGAVAGFAPQGRAHPRSAQASGRQGRGRRARRPASTRGRLLACFAVLVGAAMVTLALPHVVAAFWLWLRAPVMDLLIYDEPVSASDLYGLIASRELALEWTDAGQTYDDLAAALTVLASFEQPESAKERELLERAIAAAEASLARAPADPRGWTRLGYLRTLLTERPDRQAAQALALSLRSGRYDGPDFLTLRLRLLLVHWPVVPASARAGLGDQVRLLWQEAPDQLVGLAREPGSTDLVLAALADAPAVKSQLLDAMRGVIEAK